MKRSFKMCYWEDKADLIIDKQIRRNRNAKIFKRNHNRNYYNDICSNVLQYKHKEKSIKNSHINNKHLKKTNQNTPE